MADDAVAVVVGDRLLQLLDFITVKFDHLAGFGTNHVVVVIAAIDLVHGRTVVEIVANNQPRGFELGEHPINRGNTHVLAGIDKRPVQVFRTHVPLVTAFQDLQDFHPWQGHLKSGLAEFLILGGHWRAALLSEMTNGYYPRSRKRLEPLMPFIRTRLLSLLLLTTVSGCSSFQFPGVYKLSIQQGNIITQEMVDQLKPGMTKAQVRYIMGTPLIADSFHQDRWDYYYQLKLGNGTEIRDRLVLLFDEDKLTGIKGDFVPSGTAPERDNGQPPVPDDNDPELPTALPQLEEIN